MGGNPNNSVETNQCNFSINSHFKDDLGDKINNLHDYDMKNNKTYRNVSFILN